MGKFFSEGEIAWIIKTKEQSNNLLTWGEIAELYNKKFYGDKNFDDIKHAYHRNKNMFSDDNFVVSTLKATARQKQANATNAKENRTVISAWNNRDDILEAIKDAVRVVKKITMIPKAPKLSKDKPNMTLEILISDVHIGKLTETFNHEILQKRLKQIATTVLKEIQRAQVHYNVERVIVAFIGDLQESASMHGVESRKGCEFGDSKQIFEGIRCFFSLLLLPLAGTGIPISCVGVTGNHDRTDENRTYFKPGEENLTWITYNALKLLCEQTGLKHITWDIPTGPFTTLDIYGETVLYEHYDNTKGSDIRKGIENLMGKRTNQLKKPIHFIRGGHYHEPMEFGIGKIIVNGNIPGDDSYAEIHGFNCEPSQTLNFYIERTKSDTVKRRTSFYKRMLLQLE